MAGKPVAVTHSRGKGPQPKPNSSESTESMMTTYGDTVFNSMAEIASCSYEARQVTC